MVTSGQKSRWRLPYGQTRGFKTLHKPMGNITWLHPPLYSLWHLTLKAVAIAKETKKSMVRSQPLSIKAWIFLNLPL